MLDNILYLRGKDYTLFVAYPHHWSGRMMQIRCMTLRLYTRAYRRSETRMFLDKVNHQARIRINRFHHSHALLSCSICASISSSLRRHSGDSGLSRRRCKSAAALPRSGPAGVSSMVSSIRYGLETWTSSNRRTSPEGSKMASTVCSMVFSAKESLG